MRLMVLLALSLLVPQRAFRSGVDVVRVDVSVMRGRTPVAGLKAENFVLTDNGVPQDVDSATLDNLPISVSLVLDVSGSVAGEELSHLIDAGQQLVRTLHPDDRASLITFSQQVFVDVPLTADVSSVTKALGGLEGFGATSMNDAIHVAMNLRPLDTSRSVIIVFSDGADNLSWSRPAALIDEVKKTAVVIHAIELQTDDTSVLRPKSPALLSQGYIDRVPVLQALTLEAGGRVWSAKSSRDLKALFTQALEEMRARYLLTYSAKGVPQDGWHTLKVSLKNARGDV
ncbi:MAG TPA: VWA domain-containing protein, partial [Vicinamibacterales bacterium]|nr:VWA domain-containing protein [Vicinamibacterales bacterium]